MSNTVISVENVSKQYNLGVIGTGTFRNDLKLWWAKARNKPNPLSLVDETDHGNRDNDILWALRDVSFKVEQGEALGIIGRNGAGKSTLLKILSRVTAPTSGEVKVKGRIASLLEVGTGFHPELTGRENIFLNGAIMGMSRAEVARKFDEIVDFSGVEKFIDTPVKRYSSGMYVRLAFAVAAHLEPEILIVDEVLAVGDAEFQKKCLGKMGDVANEGKTVLFVSHNMGAIENLCKKALLLQKGKLEISGSTNNVIDYYSTYIDQVQKKANISERTDREGNGKVRVIDVSVLDNNLNKINNIRMGQTFIVKVITKGKLHRAIIGVLFGNTIRKQVVRGYTWEQVQQTITLDGNDEIECRFTDFPLIHGIYNIHIWIGEYPSECCDYIESVHTLTVEPTDIFNTGHIPDPSGGIAYVNSDWKLNHKKIV